MVGQPKATLELPDDFGEGWDYRNVRLFASGHVYAGSYSGEVCCRSTTESALCRRPRPPWTKSKTRCCGPRRKPGSRVGPHDSKTGSTL